jgi:hypothetical protein
MKVQRVVEILLAAQLLAVATPALADSADNGVASKVGAVPKVVGGVIYGVTFGVPIRMAKYIHSESHRMTETVLDDCGGVGFWNMVMARSCGIPYGIASGSILGLIRGVQYGGQYGVEEPFSKKSIGLGEPCVVGQR